jgi:hypothetical protein
MAGGLAGLTALPIYRTAGLVRSRPCPPPTRPSLFEPNHGIVTETDSPRVNGAKDMKRYAETIEIE